jgi:hypothetical protein
MSDGSVPASSACAIASVEAARVVAYTQIAQTLALAVQDAADHLRNVETIAVTAQGTALRRMLEGGAQDGVETLAAVQMMVSQGQENLERIGNLARSLLEAMRG